jgi:peptidoglycan-associated lipoprotein
MKTTWFALLLAAAACHHDTQQPTTPPPPPAQPAQADTKQLQQVTTDQQVSPNIALSGDLVQLCKINAPTATANPNFDYDKDELTPEDRTVLDQLATCLTTGPLKGKVISLIGRADPRGTEEYNLGLGSRRASSVSSYLAHLGVGQPQLGVTTRGSIDATGTDEAGWAKDRRVDIQLKQS